MAKTKLFNESDIRKRVYAFSNLHPDMSKNAIVKHFLLEGIARSTLYDILRRKTNKIGPERKVGSGRLAVKFNKTNVKRLKNRIDHRDGISQRMLAKIFNVSQRYVSKVINTKTEITYRKKTRAPKRTEEQKSSVRPKCAKIVQIFRKKEIIIDDESYFGLSNFELSTNAGFYSSNVDETPDEVKLKRKSKFEPKLLVWIAMSSKGLSKHYIAPSGLNIKDDVYIDKCLRQRLIPFIEAYHMSDDIVFWPDLAASHYSNKTQQFLASQSIDFVPKVHNPANVPELRPIEDFWSELKRRVYAKCWQAENLDQLKNRINYCLKQIDQERVHRLGKSTFTRVDAVRRNGMKKL